VDSSVKLVLPIFLFLACAIGLAVGLLILANLFNPGRPGRAKRTPYESGMDPIHDTHRRFDVRFYLLAIAFLVFDVELLFLYPWAVAWQPGVQSSELAVQGSGFRDETRRQVVDKEARRQGDKEPEKRVNVSLPVSLSPRLPVSSPPGMFPGAMVFLALLTAGFVYDWRKGVFQWR
jgi:NADH-quinone oxidoreductase subunit A